MKIVFDKRKLIKIWLLDGSPKSIILKCLEKKILKRFMFGVTIQPVKLWVHETDKFEKDWHMLEK